MNDTYDDGTFIMPLNNHDGFTEGDRAMLTRMYNFMTGGSEPERGVLMRVDRLEQARERGTFWTTTALTAAIIAIVTAAWQILTGKHTP